LRFQRVAIESIGFTLPPHIVTSEQLEHSLSPAYQRLRLPIGRLELMSGIRSRRFWDKGTAISDPSINSARLALEASEVPAEHIGCLIHASVCRDYLEPATACRVHAQLGLSENCWVYDVSNACLGILSGMVQIANLIEQGCIRAGIVVGTESARNLVESTVAALNSDLTLTRQSIKPSFASLTIGSGSCAIVLVDRDISKNGNLLLDCVSQAETRHHSLCQSDTDQAGHAMQPLMQTDSEQLLHAGVGVGRRTFKKLLEQGVTHDEIDNTVCHQVGSAHRKMMLDELGLPAQRDYSTFSWLGNSGSVALPTALAMGLKSGFIPSGSRTALLGIGSGINSIMMTTHWQNPVVAGQLDATSEQELVNSVELASSNLSC
jgi:acyl-CoA:acyl-CoA alkyltransferase